MTKRVLVATLGTSPAVVTEAIDLLSGQGARPDRVVLLMTLDPEVTRSCRLLAQHLPDHCGIPAPQQVCFEAYQDVDSSDSAVAFMQAACRVLANCRQRGERIFVSVTGGRKVMASLLALAVQFYGAERLFHVWVPPWVEEEGEINGLSALPPDEIMARLHPCTEDTPEGERPRLVDLPFIGLFPLMDDILAALKGQVQPAKQVKQMLLANGLVSKDGEPTVLGRNVATILDAVESLPPARVGEGSLHTGQHHHRDRVEDFARRLMDRFDFVKEVHASEWRQGEEQVKARPPDQLIVGARLGTDILFQFRLVTTAQGSGQLEAARKAVESFMKITS